MWKRYSLLNPSSLGRELPLCTVDQPIPVVVRPSPNHGKMYGTHGAACGRAPGTILKSCLQRCTHMPLAARSSIGGKGHGILSMAEWRGRGSSLDTSSYRLSILWSCIGWWQRKSALDRYTTVSVTVQIIVVGVLPSHREVE